MKKIFVRKGDVLEIYVDGASRGNPGPGAYSFIFVIDDETIYSESKFLGNVTNNVAEYKAVIEALEKATEFTRWKIQLHSDSQLVVNQINGDWRIRKNHLKKLYDEVNRKRGRFEEVKFFHVGRENVFIRKADGLCNKCLDEYYPNK